MAGTGIAGRIEYDSPEQLWPAVWRHTEFAKGFQIERTLYDDNQYTCDSRVVPVGNSSTAPPALAALQHGLPRVPREATPVERV